MFPYKMFITLADQYDINGQQAYVSYYHCNQTLFGPTNLTESEWLFNISDNPFEYEERNLVNVHPQIAKELNEMIQNQVQNGGFMPDQSRTVYKKSLPAQNGGVWAPWL